MCTHHWVVDPPDGRERLAARCRKCGSERTFAATLSDEEERVVAIAVKTPARTMDLRYALEAERKRAEDRKRARDRQPIGRVALTRIAQVLRSHGAMPLAELSMRTRLTPEHLERAIAQHSDFLEYDGEFVRLRLTREA